MATTAGFTAVNGEMNRTPTTSFRPATEHSTNAHDQASAKRDSAPPDLHAHSDRAREARQDSHGVHRADGLPPVKRQRVSMSSDEHPSPTPSTTDDIAAVRSLSRNQDRSKQRHEQRPRSPVLANHHSEGLTEHAAISVAKVRRSTSPPRAWKPQDVRPETSRHLAKSLQSHLEATRQRSAERNGSFSEHSPISIDSRATSSHPTGPTELLAQHKDNDRPKGKREFSRRTKTGCHTCRMRKKKCDEGRPYCKNCDKGGFVCAGYGSKPPGYTRPMQKNAPGSRNQAQVHPNMAHEAPPLTYTNGPAPSESHWSSHPRPSQHRDQRPPPHLGPPSNHAYDPYSARQREPWQPHQGHTDPSIHLQFNHLARVDYSSIPPPHSYGTDQRAIQPPPPQPDPWHPHYRSVPGPGTAHSSHDSVAASTHHRLSSTLAPLASITLTEREKMILGQPVHPYTHPQLLQDAIECTGAVDEYNKVAQARGNYGQDALSDCLERILDPAKRYNRPPPWSGPPLRGSCGQRTMIKAPFYCEYGYNLRLGEDIIIRPNVYISDPCEVTIGNGCIIGEGVKFCGWNSNINHRSPSGSQGEHRGGAIIVGDNVRIGAGAIILAFRKIGDGATIGAGSVVTKNVPPRTVVCGNPARVVRELPDSGVAETRQRNQIQQENESMLKEMEAGQRHRERELR